MQAADKDRVGKAASQVTKMQRGESGLKGAAPGRGPRARTVMFAQQSALKDPAAPRFPDRAIGLWPF